MKNNSCFFAASLLIVLSTSTARLPDWANVASALAAKHADMAVTTLSTASVTNALAEIRAAAPRYCCFVLRSDEFDAQTCFALHRMMRELDDDPFHDAIWSILSAPTSTDALRIATSSEPREIRNILATTGVSQDLATGKVMCFSDAARDATPEGDISGIFAQRWNELDPDLIVTSSHATQFNLEMPFSKGNLFPPASTSTGFRTSAGSALAAPTREKVWIAPGNCLIADNAHTPPQLSPAASSPALNMAMTALGWGKVNQFFGYIKETWYGEIGWGTWHYFSTLRLPLTESWYTANQNLIRTLPSTKPKSKDWMGKLWDLDGTVLYGDPAQKIGAARAPLPRWQEGERPLPIIFEKAAKGRRLISAPEGFEVFVADDFALVTKWPELSGDWRAKLVFDPAD